MTSFRMHGHGRFLHLIHFFHLFGNLRFLSTPKPQKYLILMLSFQFLLSIQLLITLGQKEPFLKNGRGLTGVSKRHIFIISYFLPLWFLSKLISDIPEMPLLLYRGRLDLGIHLRVESFTIEQIAVSKFTFPQLYILKIGYLETVIKMCTPRFYQKCS